MFNDGMKKKIVKIIHNIAFKHAYVSNFHALLQSIVKPLSMKSFISLYKDLSTKS